MEYTKETVYVYVYIYINFIEIATSPSFLMMMMIKRIQTRTHTIVHIYKIIYTTKAMGVNSVHVCSICLRTFHKISTFEQLIRSIYSVSQKRVIAKQRAPGLNLKHKEAKTFFLIGEKKEVYSIE